jgi:parvulin-like peptidyl-prolyl isomerase
MKRGGLILFLALLAYLLGDFLVFNGPLRQAVSGNDPAVARVSGYPISRSQLERAILETLALQGKSQADLSPSDLIITRRAALDELIDHAILRLQVQAQEPAIPVSDAEIDSRLRRFSSRFESQAALESALKSQGVSHLRDRLRAQIQQEKFIDLRIAPATQVSHDEALQWFTEHQAVLTQPERVEARHVFLPTLDHPPEEAKQTLEAALLTLNEQKKDFATLAKELSEDPATKDQGGALGWMSRTRLPADFAAPLFDMELHQPKLIRTKLGWHLVEVTGHKPSEPRLFEQAKPEIIAALTAIKRRDATQKLRKELRAAAAPTIQIF